LEALQKTYASFWGRKNPRRRIRVEKGTSRESQRVPQDPKVWRISWVLL
jgi:hypothetical protein